MTDFPRQPTDVTPQWLSTVVGAPVESFTTTPVGEGVGMLGVIARLQLTYSASRGDAPESVVVKCATNVESNRAVAMGFRVYEREVTFYQRLAPQLAAGVPHCYHAEFDAASGDFILVMQDFTGYRAGDQVEGCGVDDATRGIDVMAQLHATYWNAPAHPELDWMLADFRVDGETHRPAISGGFAVGWDPCVKAFGANIAPDILAAGSRFGANIQDLHYRMGKGPQTLVHGDFRLDNLLFGSSETHMPLVLLDWQGMLISKGTQDLAYLLSQNLRKDERREHEFALVEHYHEQLLAQGVTGYTLSEAWNDYKLAVLYLFAYAVVIGGTLDPSNERGFQFMTQLIDRASAAVMDLDLLSTL